MLKSLIKYSDFSRIIIDYKFWYNGNSSDIGPRNQEFIFSRLPTLVIIMDILLAVY